MKSVTLRDVAERAGVSIRTVSNVVNGYAQVSDPLKVRVLAAVDELGYRPNVVARNLRTGRSGLVALIVPEIDVPYFSELARLVVDAAEAHDYRVTIFQTDGLAARERRYLNDAARQALFDGVIFSPLTLPREELDDIAARLPIVLLGEHIFDGALDHVAIDNVMAARDATQHLLSTGRTRIAAIGCHPGERLGTAQLRTVGYTQSLEAAGLDVDPKLMIPMEKFHRDEGAQAMDQLLQLDSPPDSVFCFSDLLALGALKQALVRGIRVPDDLAIIGMDDIQDSRFSTPSLSTIAPDKKSIAIEATSRLLRRIENPRLQGQEVVIPHRLVVRGSSSAGALES